MDEKKGVFGVLRSGLIAGAVTTAAVAGVAFAPAAHAETTAKPKTEQKAASTAPAPVKKEPQPLHAPASNVKKAEPVKKEEEKKDSKAAGVKPVSAAPASAPASQKK